VVSDSPLDDKALAKLRTALDGVRGGALSRARLAGLAEVAPEGVVLTIDLAAERLLGVPLVVATVAHQPGSDVCFASLTPREREVAALVAAGLRNRDVALALAISVGTVKDHVHRILVKSGLDGRTQVAAVWNS
jgi:DNA-binding NarL/FixJ family response regulator